MTRFSSRKRAFRGKHNLSEDVVKYSPLQRIKHKLKLKNTVVHLRVDLTSIPKAINIWPYSIKLLDKSNALDVNKWIDLINDAYSEHPQFNYASAKKHFTNHIFLDITEVFCVMDGEDSIASISVGKYRENPKIGGLARIAVKRNYQGQGIGKFIISYGCEYLKELGFGYCEDVISIQRKKSIFTHFKCGFIPLVNSKFQQQIIQERFFFIKLIANAKLLTYYESYKKRVEKEKNDFIM